MIKFEPTQDEEHDTKQNLKVAYILHRFPYLMETFIMQEMYWIRRHGIEITIFSLLPPKHSVMHEQTKDLLPYVRHSAFLSWEVLKAQVYFLGRSPLRYLRALAHLVGQTYREPIVLLRALALFPKDVYFTRQIEQLGIEHIHAHFVWLEGLMAGVAADLLDITFSIHPHAFDLFSRDQQDVRHELENASQIITISTYHQTYIANLCPGIKPSDIEIVYCGVEIDRLQPTLDHSVGNPIQILSIGRFVEKKGLEYLVDACALLVKRGLNFQCRIAGGTGAPQSALQARINQHGLQDQVKLLGLLTQDQILDLYHQSDIFALPCVIAQDGDRDGIPVVIMEAMACELPVVTTAVAGIPDLVEAGKTGLLVQERDEMSLANALEKLIMDESLRHQLGKRARQTVLEKFQVQSNVVKMAAIFRRVSQHRPGPPVGEMMVQQF